MKKGTKRKAQSTVPESVVENGNTVPESVVENGTEPSQNKPAAVEENSTEPSQNNPAAVAENNTEPSQTNSTAVGEIEKVESSENLEKMDIDNAEPSKKASKKQVKKVETKKAVKRRKQVEKPKEEPEYFEETRNMEDLWKQTFPVGTEWELVDNIYKYNWSFRSLEEAFEKGDETQDGDEKRDGEESEKKKGILADKKVYLFGCTEPQFLSFQDKQQIVIIPVVVAAVSPFPPSDKLGITSVQSEKEEIVPMKKMKMDWVPYIPMENRLSQVERLKSNIYILGCTQRRAGLKHLKEDRVKKFTYCLPYFYQPLKEDEIDDETEVPILYPDTEPPTVCTFDWELDELEEFTDKQIEDDRLPSDKKEAFKEFVKEKVREAKKANREAKEARKKALEEMSEETKTALKNMKFYKFYPVPTADSPDVSTVKSPYINRYYGKAHAIF